MKISTTFCGKQTMTIEALGVSTSLIMDTDGKTNTSMIEIGEEQYPNIIAALMGQEVTPSDTGIKYGIELNVKQLDVNMSSEYGLNMEYHGENITNAMSAEFGANELPNMFKSLMDMFNNELSGITATESSCDDCDAWEAAKESLDSINKEEAKSEEDDLDKSLLGTWESPAAAEEQPKCKRGRKPKKANDAAI